MTKEQLEQWGISKGYQYDKYGYLVKTQNDKQYRLKISSIAARYEIKIHHAQGDNEWCRIQSGYLSKLSINDKGQLAGMTR
jgi:hypothetical protein